MAKILKKPTRPAPKHGRKKNLPVQITAGLKLIIGLGNPSPQYSQTWHNLGFVVLDSLWQKHGDDFANFTLNKKFKAILSLGLISNNKVILVKPQTFMNASGEAIGLLINFFKIKPEDIWIIHDDIDLPLGKLRISKNSSAAGHKGVQSIIDKIGSQNFIRFRLGIRPDKFNQFSTPDYVLQKIKLTDKVKVNEMAEKTISALTMCFRDDLDSVMNEFN